MHKETNYVPVDLCNFISSSGTLRNQKLNLFVIEKKNQLMSLFLTILFFRSTCSMFFILSKKYVVGLRHFTPSLNWIFFSNLIFMSFSCFRSSSFFFFQRQQIYSTNLWLIVILCSQVHIQHLLFRASELR